jgi:hypothetical protein
MTSTLITLSTIMRCGSFALLFALLEWAHQPVGDQAGVLEPTFGAEAEGGWGNGATLWALDQQARPAVPTDFSTLVILATARLAPSRRQRNLSPRFGTVRTDLFFEADLAPTLGAILQQGGSTGGAEPALFAVAAAAGRTYRACLPLRGAGPTFGLRPRAEAWR